MLGMHISLELVAADDDRLEGHVLTDDGRDALAFFGTLDLLRAIEQLRHTAHDDAAPAASRP